MTDNVFKLHAVEPPKEGTPLAEQLRILANVIDAAEHPPQTAIVVTIGWSDQATIVQHSVMGAQSNPFATMGILEAVKRSVLGA